MKYRRKGQIKTLIAAGLLSLNLAGCKKEISGYNYNPSETAIRNTEENNTIDYEEKEIEQFREDLQKSFFTTNVTLDKSSDKFISNIIIDGTNVTIELVDGSNVAGQLYNLEISDVKFENFYIYDSKYIYDLLNKEKGYTSEFKALKADYDKHTKLHLTTKNCLVNNEYKRGKEHDIEWDDDINYYNCRKLWLNDVNLKEEDLKEFSSMPYLNTLILTKPCVVSLPEKIIKIKSNSLKNIIIDGQCYDNYCPEDIRHFNFKGCTNLEKISIVR